MAVGVEVLAGDADKDGDVDLADYGLFQACLGDIASPSPQGCAAVNRGLLDGDGNGTVDVFDLEAFVECLSGPGQQAPGQCVLPAFAVLIAAPAMLEDGHSAAVSASVSGETGATRLYAWEVVNGSAVFDDPTAPDPTLWMTGNQSVVVQVTARDIDGDGITLATAVDQRGISLAPHAPFTFEVFAGGDRVLNASTTATIDLFGAYFDPAACPQQAIYWEWAVVSIPLPEGGWFDKPHRLGTPNEPVRFTPLGSWVPGGYVFSLFAHNSCSGLEDWDTVVVSMRVECVFDAQCDDGLFCNGTETCDSQGFCQLGGDPCPTGVVCDESNDTCSPSCTTDADCDDDLFCTGTETCGANGFCVAGESPCDEGETCEEGDTAAACIPPAVQSVLFTLAQDNLLGTANSDSFSAPLAVSGTGTQVPTLQVGDMANGLAGADALSATYNNYTGAAATLAPTLSSIESLILTDLGGNATTTFSGVNLTGAISLTSSGSLVDLTANNLAALAGLGVTNSDFDLAVTFNSPAYNGTTDALSLTLNGARDSNPTTTQGCTVNISTPANGIETLNVVSSGGIENVLEALIQTTGTTMTTLAVSGSTAFTVRRASPLPGTLTTISCGTATAATDLTVGGFLNVVYTGGFGSDVVNFAGTYSTADTINGAGGTNTLGIDSAQAMGAATPQNNVVNIQIILIPDSLNGNIDVTRFYASDAILDTTEVAMPLTGGVSQITLGSGNRTLTLNNDDTAHALTATVSGIGPSDTLAVNLRNADLGAVLMLNGAETVNLASGSGLDGTVPDGNQNTAISIVLAPTTGTGTLYISGSVPFAVLQGITAGTVNAAVAGAAFTMETTSCTLNVASGSVTGSPFNDELVGGAGNDGISGGDGHDSIKGNGGSDVIITGNGSDHVFFDMAGHFGDTIGDFTGGGDNVGLGSGIINFAGIAGTEAIPVELAAANFETGRSAVSQVAAGDALKIVRVSTEQTTADITSQTGAALAAYVLIFDSTLQRGVLYHDADWSSAAGRTLVCRFENITTNTGVQALTFTDFEEID